MVQGSRLAGDHLLSRELAPAVGGDGAGAARRRAGGGPARRARRPPSTRRARSGPRPARSAASATIARAVAVGREELGLAARGDHAGHVVDHVLALDRPPQRGAVVQVAGDHAHAERRERRGLARRAHQRGDLVSPAAQGLDEVAADEAGRPGDQRPHSGRS